VPRSTYGERGGLKAPDFESTPKARGRKDTTRTDRGTGTGTGNGTRNGTGTETGTRAGTGTGGEAGAGLGAGAGAGNKNGSGTEDGGRGGSRQTGRKAKWDTNSDTHLRNALKIMSILGLEGTGTKIATPSFTAAREEAIESIRAHNEEFALQDAVDWGRGSKFSATLMAEDVASLAAAGGDLVRMARERHRELSGVRLSVPRVDREISSDNPFKARLVDLVGGLRAQTHPAFRPNSLAGSRPPLRPKYLRVAECIVKLLSKTRADRRLAILPTHLVVAALAMRAKGGHWSPASWTTKRGKASGRAIIDHSDDSTGPPLNSTFMESAARELYGPIHHPTIQDVVAMIYKALAQFQAIDPTVTLADLVLFKEDVRAAYTLLWIIPEHVPLFVTELTEELSVVHFAGTFGASVTPFAFHVVSGALSHEISRVIKGLALIYTDDVIGVTLRKHLASDTALVRGKIDGLLGPGAAERDKSDWGRRLDILGWGIDLDTQQVFVAERNVRRAIAGFLSIDPDVDKLSVPEMQALASWAERYGLVFPSMAPFQRALHANYLGRGARPGGRHSIRPAAAASITAWAGALCLLTTDEATFARRLDSFALTPDTLLLEFDGSLRGAGLRVFDTREGRESLIGVACVPLTSLQLDETPGEEHASSNQNASEAIAAVTGLVLVALAVGRSSIDSTIALRGDSATVLSWLDRERIKARSDRCLPAMFVLAALMRAMKLTLGTTSHLTSAENHACDRLSRSAVVPPDLIESPDQDWSEQAGDHLMEKAVALCDPTLPLGTQADILQHFQAAHNWARSLRELVEGH
jgi:hypothetical protein